MDKDNEILLQIKKIIRHRLIIIKITTIFILAGVVFSLTLPIKFKSSSVFILQNQDNSNVSSLSSVASLVGINLGNTMSGTDIPLSMYPEISSSTKFKRMLLNSSIDNSKNLILKDYLNELYGFTEKTQEDESSIFVTENEEKLFKIISEILTIDINKRDGFVTILSTMPVAEYSTVTVKNSKKILQDIIIKYKTENAKENLNFITNQLKQKKLEFDNVQKELSYFKDSNLNLVNSLIIGKEDKLKAEFEIISAVVTELSKQVEQAKIQVKKNTPVFLTVREAVVPNKRVSPHRTKIVLIFSIIGFLSSILYVLIKNTIKEFLRFLKNSS